MPYTEDDVQVGDRFRRRHEGYPYGPTWIAVGVGPWYSYYDEPHPILVNTETGATEEDWPISDGRNGFVRWNGPGEREAIRNLLSGDRYSRRGAIELTVDFDDVDQS